jgi:hypothetical protein
MSISVGLRGLKDDKFSVARERDTANEPVPVCKLAFIILGGIIIHLQLLVALSVRSRCGLHLNVAHN